MNTTIVKTTLILLLVFSSFNLYAERVKGTIYYENDSLNVVLDIPIKILSNEPEFKLLQYKISYINNNGKLRYITPDSVKEIRFNYNGQQIRLISKLNTLGEGHTVSIKNKIFLKLELDGKLQLFSFYDRQEVPSSKLLKQNNIVVDPIGGTVRLRDGSDLSAAVNTYSIHRYALQKNNGELKRIRDSYLKNDISRFFEDCPDLIYKIKHEKINRNDLMWMVKYYNNNCLSSAGLPIE